MRIPKMGLKQSFSHSKGVLQAIRSLTVLSNCVSVSYNFDTAFLFDCTKYCSGFLDYWIGNLMGIPKIGFKQSISYYKSVLQTIFNLSNCVSGSSNFDPAFLIDCTKFCSVLSGY